MADEKKECFGEILGVAFLKEPARRKKSRMSGCNGYKSVKYVNSCLASAATSPRGMFAMWNWLKCKPFVCFFFLHVAFYIFSFLGTTVRLSFHFRSLLFVLSVWLCARWRNCDDSSLATFRLRLETLKLSQGVKCRKRIKNKRNRWFETTYSSGRASILIIGPIWRCAITVCNDSWDFLSPSKGYN